MKTLGLDLSLQSTGWCVLRDGLIVDGGSMREGAKLRELERLLMFDSWIDQLLERHVPDVVALEGYSYGTRSGATHAFAIGEVGGIVKVSAAYAHRRLVVIPPATWKKALCGKGNLQKDQVRLEVFKRYQIEFESQDTLDAWCVAMCCHRQELGLDKPEPKPRGRKSKQVDAPLLAGLS